MAGNTKRISKHSKRFERTQTGCLQCRQKKKKCDGKRPQCQSCDKKGIQCDFPANIRIFQYNQVQKANNNVVLDPVSKRIAKSDVNSKKPISFKQVELKHPICEVNVAAKGPAIVDEEAKESLISLSSKIEHLLDEKDSTNSSLLQSRSDSISSLISDSDADSVISSTAQPQTPPSSSGNYQISESQRAANLIYEGGSIGKILDKMTIDLIKKSINNLQYIDFEKKLNFSSTKREELGSEKIEQEEQSHYKSLGYLEKFVPDDIIFQPDEYLSFD